MKNLKNYVKSDDGINCEATSVSIRKDQLKFIRDNHIRVSELIRDLLDEAIPRLKEQLKGKSNDKK